MSRPSQKEPRLPSPLGGPHVLFDGSFILEFLQPSPELDASVLMRATYVGGHEAISAGKQHPQAPPLHIHLTQSESFVVESGAVGTTTTYDCIDTIHTASANHLQSVPRPGLSPPVPSRTVDGVTVVPPWTPHKFWPVAPDHPFWSTEEGQQCEASLPNGRNPDTTVLIWAHPRTGSDTPTGRLASDFPPDMDAAFFLALLSFVDAITSRRVAMTPSTAARFFGLQTESGLGLLIAPSCWWLGPLRWMIPWSAQCALEWVRKMCGGKDIVKLVEDVIEEQVVKRQ